MVYYFQEKYKGVSMKKVFREIGMIARCVATINDIEYKELNLAKGQFLYLVRIYENPGIIQERVADLLKVDRSTAAKAIKKLVEMELVKKNKSEKNKKELKLYCTPKGENLYPLLQKEEKNIVKSAMEGMSLGEKQIVFELLYKMRINVEKKWEKTKKENKRSN